MGVNWWNKMDTNHEFCPYYVQLVVFYVCDYNIQSTFMNVVRIKQSIDSFIGIQPLGKYTMTMEHPST